MKRVLVTGGAGFIGSFLCERLLAEGCAVVCVDNFFTGSRENISHLAGREGFQVVEHDVVQPLDLEVEEIFNLACPASPVHYQADPIQTVKTNFLGALNLLELAERSKARILQASTSEIYGDPRESPQREGYWGHVNPVGPRSCYDEGKRVAETLMTDFHRGKGTDTLIVRIFNTYGPRMHIRDGRVVSNFIVQALRGQPLTIYGDGRQTRAFCFVSDLVEGILRAMACEGFHGPVNLGNPAELTVLELAERVKSLTGSAAKIEFRPAREDDPVHRKPEISLAREKLGWEPEVPLEEGLKRTISFFEGLLEKSGGC